MRKYILLIIVSAFFSSSNGGNVISLPFITTDFAYSRLHNKLYAIIDAMDPIYGNRLIEININTGNVEKALFVGSQPYLLKLTTDENFAWMSFEGTPFIKRVNLSTFEIDKELFLGPSNQWYEPNHRLSSVFAYNFAVFQNDNNKLALGLKTPYEFDFEALSLYKNDTIQPIKLVDSDLMKGYYPFSFEPVINGNYLIGHWQSSSESVYSKIKVLDNGLEFINEDITMIHGQGLTTTCNWFSVHNDTLYTSEGEIMEATSTANLKKLGLIENNIVGYTYGYTFSDIHNSFIYPNIHNNSLYLTFYNKNTFAAFDSIYLFESPFYRYILVMRLEAIDKNRFAILIEKDYEDFTMYIIERESTGIETININIETVICPNPTSNKLYVKGYPLNKKILVYTIEGKFIESFDHSGMSAEINLSNYPSGLYMVKVSDIEGKYISIVKKIVIQQ